MYVLKIEYFLNIKCDLEVKSRKTHLSFLHLFESELLELVGSILHKCDIAVAVMNKNDVMRLGERPRSLEGKPNISRRFSSTHMTVVSLLGIT